MHKDEAAALFKALSDPTRVKIVKVLYHNEKVCACKFLKFTDCGQPTLSHHLAVLSKVGLISGVKEGVNIMYSCNKTLVDQLMAFIATRCSCADLGD